ncbi:MAG: Type 1 glutamine amidotransferase-like domain-containing protein [Promethearchaeota archaeon]
MQRIVLFSTPDGNPNLATILNLIFPPTIVEKRALFMPSQGIARTKHKQKYLDVWQAYAHKYHVPLDLIDNCSSNSTEEHRKLQAANILIISGGDPFQLLLNLRQSGLDHAIKQFTQKQNFILAGYSAGASVLTPNLAIARLFNHTRPEGKKYASEDRLQDFNGLGIVEFEICPHFSTSLHQAMIEDYVSQTNHRVHLFSDEDYFVQEFPLE